MQKQVVSKFGKKIFGNPRGQAVLQVVMGAVITGLVALTSISLVNQQKKEANTQRVKSRARDLEARIQGYIENDIAWKRSVDDATNNAGMACLRTGSPSDCRGVAAANALTRFYLWSDVTTTVTPYVNVDPSGLKLDGNTCSPYGAASNACPIRVKLCWQAVDVKSPPPANIAGDGPNGTDCGIDTDATQIDCTVANGSQDCKIRIRGTFEYQATGQGLGFGARLKSENYTVNFTRGSADKAQYVHVTDRKVKNTPGGGCTAGAWNNRVFNTLVADTGGNVVGFTNGSDQTSITLKAGTYQCEVSAPSGTTTEHQARLVVGGAPTLSGSSGYYYSPSNIAGNFTITANTAPYNVYRSKHLSP